MGNMKLKANRNGKVFLSRIVRGGKAQTQFKAKAVAVGACVKSKTEGKSFTRGDQTKILKQCVVDNGLNQPLGTIDNNSYYQRMKRGEVGNGQPYHRSV